MTTPSVPAQLQTALDELDMAHNSLAFALDDAHLSAMHSTYTAAIKRILHFNAHTMTSLGDLLATLHRQAAPNQL